MMNKIMNLFKSINRRSLKYGSLSIILVVAVVAIAVIVNLFVGTLQDKGIIKTKFDLSSNKMFSIGDKSKAILKDNKKDVTIYGLFDTATVNASSFAQIKSVIDQYGQYKHITVKYVDSDKNPGLLKELDPSGLKNIQKQDFIIKCPSTNKIKVVTYDQIIQTVTDPQTYQTTGTNFIGEQSFTGAIKFVTSDKTPVVYFTQGHQEGDVDSNYKNLKTQLESNNYEVKAINLLINNKIPADAAILIVASPQTDLSVSEKNLLKDYVSNGGNVVYLFDYIEKNPKFTQFEDLLQNYNVGLDYDKVKETDTQRYIQSPYAVVLDAPQSTIIPQDYQLLLLNSRSLRMLSNTKEYVTLTALAKTSDKAVGEQIDKASGADISGPLNLAIAVDYKGGKAPGKVLVMGNGSFITDAAQQTYGQYFQYGNNFFTMSLNWMMDKEDEVVIDAKSYDTAKLNLSSQAQANLIAFMVVIVLPLLILGFGTFVWLRRRHL
jgi:ABC-2 type transport system permease protein